MARITVRGGTTQRLIVTNTPKDRILINTSGGATLLTQLKDVDASNLTNNDTIVYNEASGKFVVEELPIINGGEF